MERIAKIDNFVDLHIVLANRSKLSGRIVDGSVWEKIWNVVRHEVWRDTHVTMYFRINESIEWNQ